MKKNFYIKNVFKVFKNKLSEKTYEEKLLAYNENYSKITGVVKDILGNPIENAVIKVMSNNYEPLIYTSTDKNGFYSFDNIMPDEIYIIFCIAKGMKLSEKERFLIKRGETFNINFILENDSSINLGIVIGNLEDKHTGEIIKNATIELNSMTENVKNIQAITYANDSGRYVFTEIPKGEYSLKINSFGYKEEVLDVAVNENNEIISIKNELIASTENLLGTVSGIITNKHNMPINRADVILYRIESDNTLTPIDFTKTNESGVYLFINVPIGNYKVESNLIEKVIYELP